MVITLASAMAINARHRAGDMNEEVLGKIAMLEYALAASDGLQLVKTNRPMVAKYVARTATHRNLPTNIKSTER